MSVQRPTRTHPGPTSSAVADRGLPGDVEVLTANGWTRGVDLRTGEQVAAWDPNSGAIALEPAQLVEIGRSRGHIISLAGGGSASTGHPERGVWVSVPIGDEGDQWTPWHRRSLTDLADLPRARIPVAGHHRGRGLRSGDPGDYAGVLGWITVEEGYHGTSIQIRTTESNRYRAASTGTRLAALGAHHKRAPGRDGGHVDAWFLPGPLTASIRHDLIGGLVRWTAVWAMSSPELDAFVDGAIGARRRTIHRVEPDTVDVMQAISAITGYRTVAHDVGRRAGGTLDLTAGADASISHDVIKRRADSWDGLAFALTTTTGAVIARRNWRVFVAAT